MHDGEVGEAISCFQLMAEFIPNTRVATILNVALDLRNVLFSRDIHGGGSAHRNALYRNLGRVAFTEKSDDYGYPFQRMR